MGTSAEFIPGNLGLPAVKVMLQGISKSAVAALDQIELASSHGGQVPDRADGKHALIPVSAQYAVRAKLSGALPDAFESRTAVGVMVANGAPESLASRAWRQILRVLVRESGM